MTIAIHTGDGEAALDEIRILREEKVAPSALIWVHAQNDSGLKQIEAAKQGAADLPTLAPGVAAALVTTVAGLLVAIPSMFGYNWLVHNLRVMTVELDNFAQELVTRMETEYFKDEEDAA